ncbi:hypothetical protein AYO20_03219 [Fonsecaea nubica]|uniref:Uncharacterized protein n=1 Tax=Fonsecaea nubica TaxID=856822 RepID=A0A178D558_9EURO|nr:hypothetical protein AYO20_03219 [Fonsecaea nubica]OAL37370.1 hypothetical protein AYO20_03219 [Fonsecaea nubica]
MAGNVALITGGASGMGLAVTEKLLSKGWKVTIFDFNAKTGAELAEKLGSNVLFVQGNAAVYSDQAKAFLKTWEKWQRLDFVFANAGVGDRVDLFADAPEAENGAPPQPDILPIDVCLNGVIWSAYLAFHYFKKNAGRKGKLAITASFAGIYAGPEVPLYAAAKHGVRLTLATGGEQKLTSMLEQDVALARSLGKLMKSRGENITVNCICPTVVATNLISAEFAQAIPPNMITPMTTIVRAIEKIIEDDSVNACVFETCGEDIIPRSEPAPANKVAAFYLGADFSEVNANELELIKERGKALDQMATR